MGYMKIFFCKKCGILDYADGRCPRCKSAELDEASTEFLVFGSKTAQSSEIPVLLTRTRPIEKIGCN